MERIMREKRIQKGCKLTSSSAQRRTNTRGRYSVKVLNEQNTKNSLSLDHSICNRKIKLI
ncbi:hypothetical protein C5167_032845 [Papaver somniferum]|uniref:Uncharacterized protein n=1 Tax=Papaver somniferum TaxID=3469 RepID=A0A4Y7KBJ1_PAPSO|nr:hypothetical protein C5167_032845 [Papaver somniferum]